jgi:hypothetical protein
MSKQQVARTGGRDLAAELDDDDGTFAESWKPRAGDKITGVLVRYDEAQGAFGPCPVAIIDALNDVGVPYPVTVWIGPAMLRSEFKKVKPKPGERIGIKRFKDSEKGYARYRVIVDRPDEKQFEPNWDALDDLSNGDDTQNGVRAGAGAAPADNNEDLPF